MLGPAKLFEVGLFQIFFVYHGHASLDVFEWSVFLRETIIHAICFLGLKSTLATPITATICFYHGILIGRILGVHYDRK